MLTRSTVDIIRIALQKCSIKPDTGTDISFDDILKTRRKARWNSNDYAMAGGGTLIYFLFVVFAFEKAGLINALFGVVFFFGFAAAAFELRASREAKARFINDTHERRQQHIAVAVRQSQRVRDTVYAALIAIRTLNAETRVADNLITSAVLEFADNAFVPFWNKVREAVDQLAKCRDQLKALCEFPDQYVAPLLGRQHNFPPFPVTLDMIDNPVTVSARLLQIYRQAITHFQFAVINEKLQSRRGRIAGYPSIEEALTHIDESIRTAYYSLQRSIEDSKNKR